MNNQTLVFFSLLAFSLVAAQVLYRHGQSNAALQCLVEGLQHPEPFVVLPAANAIDHLGELAKPALPAIRQYLDGGTDPDEFESKLPVWLLTGTLEDLTR